MHNHLCTVSTEAQIPNGVKHLKLCIFHFKYGPMSWGYFIYIFDLSYVYVTVLFTGKSNTARVLVSGDFYIFLTFTI